jgi:hypothetical protein
LSFSGFYLERITLDVPPSAFAAGGHYHKMAGRGASARRFYNALGCPPIGTIFKLQPHCAIRREFQQHFCKPPAVKGR